MIRRLVTVHETTLMTPISSIFLKSLFGSTSVIYFYINTFKYAFDCI